MVDVCVVGGGIGGLAAARLLSAQNLAVVVLEARSRMGGRALSIPVDGGALDLGATWF
jgi:monoamine oxidase